MYLLFNQGVCSEQTLNIFSSKCADAFVDLEIHASYEVQLGHVIFLMS